MAVEILMPELGESVHEGTVSRWLKQVGDKVQEDEPIVEIMTDKVNTELPSPASGVLSEILVQEGGLVAVFTPMGVIDDGGAPIAAQRAEAAPAQPKAKQTSEPNAAAGERQWFTPVVRAIAKEHGVTENELNTIRGSGEGGRITKRDLEAFIASGRSKPAASPQAPPKAPSVAAPTPAATPTSRRVPLTAFRKMTADAMVRSSQVPTVSTVAEVDVTRMVQFRERNKESFQQEHGVKLTYTPFFIKAAAEALMEFPVVNGSLQADSQMVLNDTVNMGVSVALGKTGDEGLIVPVIRNCDRKTIAELAKDLDTLVQAARSSKLSVSDVQGATFTLTNPGSYGALFGTPMLVAPQAGILGTYGIKKQVVVVDEMIAIRSIMHLVLTYDHRIVDGLLAGRFLASVRDRLENFDFLR